MSSHVETIALNSLTTREAVIDAIYRGLLSIDENDPALFDSAWAGQDVAFEFNGRPTEGFDAIKSFLLGSIGPLDTTHSISNVRVDLKDGADTAKLTANFIAQHGPPGRGLEADGPKFLAGGRYWVDVVKDETDGLWKVKKWALKLVWRQGDESIMQSAVKPPQV